MKYRGYIKETVIFLFLCAYFSLMRAVWNVLECYELLTQSSTLCTILHGFPHNRYHTSLELKTLLSSLKVQHENDGIAAAFSGVSLLPYDSFNDLESKPIGLVLLADCTSSSRDGPSL